MVDERVGVGVIGLGKMGISHARRLKAGQISGARLAAVCDVDEARFQEFAPTVATYRDAAALLADPAVHAVIIATPHTSHPSLTIAALDAGRHVLLEKPIAIDVQSARQIAKASIARNDLVAAAMFNQRTDPMYRTMREQIAAGALGRLQRVTWIITDWFRTDAYYRSNAWRATWRGEGGGALLNQCPHNLDLLLLLAGAPSRVRAVCRWGLHHRIEVEDEVTATLEYANGATGVFVTSTGEAPGVNRLELVGTGGRLLADGRKLISYRNKIHSDIFSRESPELFAAPETEQTIVEFPDAGTQHIGIIRNFIDAIRSGAPLIAPLAEGVASVELANAMLYSGWSERPVNLPLDGDLYAAWLHERQEKGTKS